MSQTDVYNILKELGGRASITEIRQRAKEKYPDRTLYLYITNRLKKLEKKKCVKRIGDEEVVDHEKKDTYEKYTKIKEKRGNTSSKSETYWEIIGEL